MIVFIKIAQHVLKWLPAKLLVKIVHQTLIISKYRVQVINKNYISTIGKGLSDKSFSDFYRKCVHNIAKVLVETLTFDKKKASKLNFRGIRDLEKECHKNNGLILMASHYGNWELACINLPLHTDIPCYGVYKPLKNKKLDKHLIGLRSRFGLKLVPMNRIARSMASNHSTSQPAIYILIADQNPRSIQNVVWVKFLDTMSAYSNGLLKMRDKYSFGVSYMRIIPRKGMYEYDIDFEFPSDADSDDLIQWYSDEVETQINTDPHHWLWSHKRWKRKHHP